MCWSWCLPALMCSLHHFPAFCNIGTKVLEHFPICLLDSLHQCLTNGRQRQDLMRSEEKIEAKYFLPFIFPLDRFGDIGFKYSTSLASSGHFWSHFSFHQVSLVLRLRKHNPFVSPAWEWELLPALGISWLTLCLLCGFLVSWLIV